MFGLKAYKINWLLRIEIGLMCMLSAQGKIIIYSNKADNPGRWFYESTIITYLSLPILNSLVHNMS